MIFCSDDMQAAVNKLTEAANAFQLRVEEADKTEYVFNR